MNMILDLNPTDFQLFVMDFDFGLRFRNSAQPDVDWIRI